MKELILFNLCLVICACAVPIFQIIKHIADKQKIITKKTYYFPNELFNRNMDSLSFENAISEGTGLSRISLNDRGWIRMPVGKIITESAFEQQKTAEYKICLP